MSNSNKEAAVKNETAKTPTANGQNGKDQKPELSNVSVDKKTGELSERQEQPEKVLPPIELRLKKLSDLLELQEKREVLVQHLENLNRFYISPSGTGCNLKLTDSKGNSFGISHPAIIGEMVNIATGKLQDELTNIEAQFIFEI